MAAAAVVTIAVGAARLTVALVDRPVHLATVLATVSWHFIVPRCRLRGEQVVPVPVIHVFLLLKDTVIDSRRDGPRAERTLNESMASHGSIGAELAAARACTLCIGLASHAFALVGVAVGVAGLAGDAGWAIGELGRQAPRRAVALHVMLIVRLIGKAVRLVVILSGRRILLHDHVIVALGSVRLGDIDPRIVLLRHLRRQFMALRFNRLRMLDDRVFLFFRCSLPIFVFEVGVLVRVELRAPPVRDWDRSEMVLTFADGFMSELLLLVLLL